MPALNDSHPQEIYELAMANSIWCAKRSNIHHGFEGVVNHKWQSNISEVDFTFEEAAKEINNQIKKATLGKVNGFIDGVSPSTEVLLISTLYFEGKWKKKFLANHNTMGGFNNADGSKSITTFMNMT